MATDMDPEIGCSMIGHDTATIIALDEIVSQAGAKSPNIRHHCWHCTVPL